MGKRTVIFLLYILYIFTVDAWRGNICSTVKSRRESYTYCAYRNWAGACCAWRRGQRTVYYTEHFCCRGWRHNGNQDCSIAICTPNCFYGGSCVRPNQCDCTDGRTGQFCAENACASYTKPCYPGWCDQNSNCLCNLGYSGSSCLTFSDPSLVPQIDRCRTTFSHYNYVKGMIVYSYYVDGTGREEREIAWTNQPAFNRIQFNFQVIFDTKYTIPLNLTNFPPIPNYIESFRIGIVSAQIDMTHYTFNDGTLKFSSNSTCSGVSNDSPKRDEILNCTLSKDSYTSSIESGDTITLTYRARSGGFRKLLNRDTGQIFTTEYYTGRTDTKVMEFKIDFEKPTHCQERYTCSSGEEALHVTEEITKSEIVTRWSGWRDQLSQMFRYAWEIFELTPDHNGHLTEFHRRDKENEVIPPEPLVNVEIMHNGSDSHSFAYTPPRPGIYSIVLEAGDAANNTKYARRFVIYDPVSTVTINSNQNARLYASSAAEETGYFWQSSVNKTAGGVTSVDMEWANHFGNRRHEEGKFLNRILALISYLDDVEVDTTGNTFEKRVDYKRISSTSGLDDNFEKLRVNQAIPNFHGIVQFEIAHDYDETGGSTISGNGLQWRNTTQFLERDTATRNDIRDGGTMEVFVRATDIMGNNEIDSTLIHFDSTEPVLEQANIQKNVKNGTYDFSSRITVRTNDEHSGIHKIMYRFIADDTKMVKHSGFERFPKMSESQCRNMPCYKVNMGDYYAYETSFDINHCWLMVPKEKLDTQVINLELTSFNLALLNSTTTIKITNIRGLDGIEDYFPPMYIKVETKTDTGVSITWAHSPTCHDRTEIIVKVVKPGGEIMEFPVHKDATRFDIAGLAPETSYSIMLFNKYGDVQSDESVPVEVQTAPHKGPSGGAIAGIVIGVLIGVGLLLLIVGIVCWRTGRMPKPIHDRVDRPLSVIFKTDSKPSTLPNDYQTPAKSKRRQIYSANLDEDVYYWAGQSSDRINRSQVSLETEVTRGRFAVIYKANYCRDGRNSETVVAKVLHEKYTEEDRVLMDAKINFLAKVVGSHPNIIKFIGAVDDDALGPFMILEYCETGTLKEYLKSKKNKVDDNVMEKLFRFGFDISKGMEYLAGLNIVHRKLAARNILLTFTLDVKITGFGPMPPEEDSENSEKKEMVPIKWLAPECIINPKSATEKSDVWSFGVVLWEIFSLGESPYSDIRSRDLHSRLMQGERLQKPEHCDDVFYGIMKKCWNKEAKKRPTFKTIKGQIEGLFVTGPGDDYYYEHGHLYDNRK